MDRIDLDNLLRFRLIVARFGEMDLAKWWNTKGQLGRLGAAALRRGFPRTHHFAQARSVFAVAAHRCAEVFDPPGLRDALAPARGGRGGSSTRAGSTGSTTPASGPPSSSSSSRSQGTRPHRRPARLRARRRTATSTRTRKLRRSAEGRAVPLPGVFAGTDADVALLALGFARGEPARSPFPTRRSGGRMTARPRARTSSRPSRSSRAR